VLLISFDSFAQVTIDKTVETRYKKTLKKMKLLYQQNIAQLEKKEPFIGISVFTFYQVDTLNKKDFIKNENDVTVEDINPTHNKKRLSAIDENIYIPVFSVAELINDTLHLAVGIPFQPTIKHTVYLGKVTSAYEEYYKYDSVLRLDLKDTKVSKLSIPIETKKFLINTSSYKAGQLIYGQVEFETAPYYYDTFGFKNNYIKKRLRCIYLFKVRVKKNST
jgi:hypothetical protein